MPAGFSRRAAEWLDVRPAEVRVVVLSFLSSFCVLSFLVLARSLREALYITAFPVETLPYITAGVAALTLLAVGRLTAVLSRRDARSVVLRLCAAQAAGLLLLWPAVGRSPLAVVAFYLWTATGTLLLGSGFWVVTSERFAVRGAKRLFGLISAGGTLGAMLTGNSLGWLTARFDPVSLIGLLVLFLAALFAAQGLLPAGPPAEAVVTAPHRRRSSLREGLALAWRKPHLRTMALIVLVATMASTLVDYQFKERAWAVMATPEGLTGFFGAFYGWTGGVALAVQLLVTARLLASRGVAASLSVLPALLLFGSGAMLLAPGLLVATLLRGGDNSLRKSLHRSVLEFLYVPLAPRLRRRTKPVIDSMVDSLGEALGALVVFLWVTLPGFPSRYLSLFVVVLAGFFLLLARRMGRLYFDTLEERLTESGGQAEALGLPDRLDARNLLTATLTRLEITRPPRARALGSESEADLAALRAGPLLPARAAPPDAGPQDLVSVLASSNAEVIASALSRPQEWSERHVPHLIRLLARDSLLERVTEVLTAIGEPAVPYLATVLRDEGADFVIRRRIPRVLARLGGAEADAALVHALAASRFEVRYRAALALARRRRRGLPEAAGDWRSAVWDAVRAEVSRERPVWELQRLLDGTDPAEDDLVARRAGVRGELSLEHTFRLLGFVLDPEAVRSAYHGIVLDEEVLKSFSLEYLEQVLPPDVRRRLWPFIGDVSEGRRRREIRSLEDVVSDLMRTGATLFAAEADREALRRVLDSRDRGGEGPQDR